MGLFITFPRKLISHLTFLHFITLLFTLLLESPCYKSEKIQMKMIEDAANTGANYPYQGDQSATQYQLKMRVPPSNFSGPLQMKRLIGKCFSKVDDSYKYEFCPFSNVTQHEQSLRWNPYSGVLGVWQEWEIENNTFIAMQFSNGDSCGSIYRSVKVLFQCGNSNQVTEVSEPHTCQYQLIFKTPLVCHPNAMLVYPLLPSELQHKWNLIEGELANEEITQQGYKKKVACVFEEAGYILPQHIKEETAKQALTDDKGEDDESEEFESLLTCSQKYKKLKEELEAMKTLLAVYQGTNDTKDKNGGSFNLPGHPWLPGDDDHLDDSDHHMWNSEELNDDE